MRVSLYALALVLLSAVAVSGSPVDLMDGMVELAHDGTGTTTVRLGRGVGTMGAGTTMVREQAPKAVHLSPSRQSSAGIQGVAGTTASRAAANEPVGSSKVS